MSPWTSLVEWYFDIAASAPGEGTQWEWSSASPWPAGWPHWLTVCIGLAAVAGLVWLYLQDSGNLSLRQRITLLGLRFSALLVALWLWTQPALVVARAGLPPVAVLVDTSASMSLRDGSASTSDTESPRRWDQVLQAFRTDQSQWLSQLSEAHPLRFYQFSTTAQPVPAPPAGQSFAAEFAKTLAALPAEGAATRPAEAVRQVLAELRGAPPAAMVVFTDGIASESEADRLSTVTDVLRRRGTDLFIVPVGASTPPRDLQLFDVVMDEVAFVNDPVIVSGKIRAVGVDAREIAARVLVDGRSDPLAQQNITLSEQNGFTKFELTLTPTEAAELDLSIEISPVAGEADTQNNRERRHLAVRQEKLHVLLVESAPRYEFRYLKQWLERDPTITLQTLLVEADPDYAREDRTALAYFPVEKTDLWNYDVIILGDVPLSYFGATAADWLVDFVREKGGGLLLIAGAKSNPATYLGTSLERVLPFAADMVNPQGMAASDTEAYQPRLTLDGQKGVPMFRLETTELASLETWNRLPGFYGLLPIQRLKPGVRTLVEHPYSPAAEGRLPVITLQQIGAGKVLFHATDELWRWRFRTGDTYFGKYWGQAIRYLSRGKLLGKDRSAELVVDRQTYVSGEPVLLRVRFLDDRLVPQQDEGVVVTVERAGANRRDVTLNRLPHLPTVFETQLTGLADGVYHAWISRPALEGTVPTADFRVDSQQRELQRKAADRADLELAAKLSGGQIVELADVAQLPRLIPQGRLIPLEQGRTIPVWSRWEPLLLFLLLLTTEWILRRRWRLL